jgi:hypothetical protein
VLKIAGRLSASPRSLKESRFCNPGVAQRRLNTEDNKLPNMRKVLHLAADAGTTIELHPMTVLSPITKINIRAQCLETFVLAVGWLHSLNVSSNM